MRRGQRAVLRRPCGDRQSRREGRAATPRPPRGAPMSRRAPKVRRHSARISNLQAALAASAVVLVACYLVFGGPVPFTSSGFVLRAAFTANTELHIPSPVRIAGVEVGQVTSVRHPAGSAHRRRSDHADQLAGSADPRRRHRPDPLPHLPGGQLLRRPAPRHAGSAVLHSGAELPAANTSGPVQLDRILSALDTPARTNLQRLVRGLGAHSTARPPRPRTLHRRPRSRPHRGRGSQSRPGVLGEGVHRVGDRQPSPARTAPPRSERCGVGQRRRARRPVAESEPAVGPRRHVRPDDDGAGQPTAGAGQLGRRAPPVCSETQTPPIPPWTHHLGELRPSPGRSCPESISSARRSPRLCPGSVKSARCLPPGAGRAD